MSHPAPRDAPDPFSPTSDEINTADLVIRSSDMVDFHVHKAIMSFGSVVFKNMLSFPEPTGLSINDTKDGKPIVALTESSHAIEKLLILCYPRFVGTYPFRNLDGLDAAYEAAKKYQIPGGQKLLEKVLEEPRFLEGEPHRVFVAIACHRGLDRVAKLALVQTLRLPHHVSRLSIPEFKLISAHHLWQLLDFHHRCSEIMISLLQEFTEYAQMTENIWDAEEFPQYTAVWWDMDGHSALCGPIIMDEDYLFPAKWFQRHIQRAEDAARLSPDIESIKNIVKTISWETLAEVSQCPKCATLAPEKLGVMSLNLQHRATLMYGAASAKLSFVD
ncbi:hypothetical protein C8R47DRAFT_1051349 [Mycena vitilis]|nr:hypothetical protein C8R47DRAFT_1051349 [Mycena vitilis]